MRFGFDPTGLGPRFNPVTFSEMIGRLSSLASTAAVAAFFCGCTESDPVGELIERPKSAEEREFKFADTSAERFRYQSRPAADSPQQQSGGPRLVYDTPEGWEEAPASMMRDINLTFGESGEGETYVARLPGAGGGLLANVNRWRQQMGAEELTQEEVDALPEKPLFGQPAKFIEIDGAFSGMGGGESKPDYRMLGLILTSDAGAVFVKMTGPKQLVEENAEKFDAFTQSIDVSVN